ncbi:MAG: outer membrane immunogenic protein [Gammaproteobacteria bacterium]|jgi:outer membrane immunogenic protein
MKHLISIFILVAFLSPPMSASANWFLGAKAGNMAVSFDNDDVDSDPFSTGVTIGYDLSTSLQGLAAEFEITRTVSPGEVVDQDLEVDSQGLYLSYQTTGQFYFKGRLGLMDASLSAGALSEDEGGESYGLALGVRQGQLAYELDFTAIDDDVSFISLGVIFRL